MSMHAAEFLTFEALVKASLPSLTLSSRDHFLCVEWNCSIIIFAAMIAHVPKSFAVPWQDQEVLVSFSNVSQVSWFLSWAKCVHWVLSLPSEASLHGAYYVNEDSICDGMSAKITLKDWLINFFKVDFLKWKATYRQFFHKWCEKKSIHTFSWTLFDLKVAALILRHIGKKLVSITLEKCHISDKEIELLKVRLKQFSFPVR